MKVLLATMAFRMKQTLSGIRRRIKAWWYVSMLNSIMDGMQETYDRYVGTALANLYNPDAHQRMRVAYVTASDLYDQGNYRQALRVSRRAYRQHITG